ncbi:unnamed protein product [Mycena citricolor]|uniref:mRNA cap guanine-N(7) methyltransferase n=1 Tax=Mycena citricolor TaxID=2018698 RepID=A0AAD2HRB9_9AGAR|nr:unnamed protein product [Mycena citricolor]
MPAFDPVRDAVRNSPVLSTQSLSLLNSPQLPSHPPTPQTPSRALPAPTRRATALSALLNNEEPPKSSKISQLLRTDSEEERIATRIGTPSLFDSPSLVKSPGDDQLKSAPAMQKTLKYQPTKRISPASSVLRPMSRAEMDMYKTFQGKGSARLSKRKRSRSRTPDHDQPPQKKHAGDVGVVVEHYNARPEVGVVQREKSPIIGLKSFNNWVKSVLISLFAHPALLASKVTSGRGSRGSGRGKVLDMGCGKGGDLTKWAKSRAAEVLCVDIASVSVDQARARWQGMRGYIPEASFASLDCYSESLARAFSPAKLAGPLDAVSMQFCMHYAFESVQKARCMLDNVSRWLRTGGVFIGTIPNAEQLLQNLAAIPPDAPELTFGNGVYKIRFAERNHKGYFGHKYWFYLQDAVEDVPEYVVHWDNLVQMAAEYGLHPVYKQEFHEVFEDHREHKDFGPLMVKMNVVDANGESAMDEDQWEAANIYIAFAFEKR